MTSIVLKAVLPQRRPWPHSFTAATAVFAVNGTTQAIQAMLMTAVKPGGKVLIPRNAHRSVAGGLLLGDLEPVYVLPQFDAVLVSTRRSLPGRSKKLCKKILLLKQCF